MDYYDENGIHSPEGYGEPPRKRDISVFVFVGCLVLLAFGGGYLFFMRGEGGAPAATAGPPSVASPSPSPLPNSHGITQAQLDELGDSIGERYESGDTEVAQALLSNFMDMHPECVSAVMAGGEGTVREVLKESERVAEYLKSTAPNPTVHTTVITVKNDDGTVKAAVLGVSCK